MCSIIFGQDYDPFSLLPAARVVRSKAQTSKGYGFVKFQHVQQAVEAIRTFNGFILNNHQLEVKFADQDAGPPLSGKTFPAFLEY